IHSDEIILLLPGRHPLASKRYVTARDLADQPLLLPKSGTTRARLNSWLEPVEDQINISMELDSTEMIKRFVMAGLGCSFLAASNCQEELAAGKLSAVSLGPGPLMRGMRFPVRIGPNCRKQSLPESENEVCPASR